MYTIQAWRNILDTVKIVLMNKIHRLKNEKVLESDDRKNKEEK